MGLFDFARGIGKKLFGDEDEAPEKLKEHIEENNPGVSNLQIKVEDGVATLSGEAETPEALEKAVLMAGNAMGIGEVKAEELSAPEQTVEVEYYEVERGDSLWKIAEQFYGSGTKHDEIFQANREVIQDPDLIFPGQKLRIPALD